MNMISGTRNTDLPLIKDMEPQPILPPSKSTVCWIFIDDLSFISKQTMYQKINKRHLGNSYEDLACEHLETEGLIILARNYRVKAGEIDIIAREGGYIVFVEVKYRAKGEADALSAVDFKKQRKISRTALYYLHHKQEGMQTPMRFDVISVTDGEIRWIRDAFPFTD